MIVADASVLLEVLLHTEIGGELETQLFAAGQTIHIPYLTDLEVLEVLRRYSRTTVISVPRARPIEEYTDIPLNRYPHNVLAPRIWELRHNFTAYDAAYIGLAEALDAPLITCDGALAIRGHRAKVMVF